MNREFWLALDKLVSMSEIIIDRPKGSKHPKYGFEYIADYGYLKDTSSQDGNGVDVWKGTDSNQSINAIICTVDLLKRDSEIKILLGCTEAETTAILNFHNDSENMKGILIRRLLEKGENMSKYNVITLCGSAKFKNEFIAANKALTLAGNIVISVGFFDSGDVITTEQKQMLAEIHKAKIDLSDAIFVINKNGCIGESTRLEIEYAKQRGKIIDYLEIG